MPEKEEIMALYEITTKQEFEDKVLKSAISYGIPRAGNSKHEDFCWRRGSC